MQSYQRGDLVFVQTESDVEQVLEVKEDLGEAIVTLDKMGRFGHHPKKKVTGRLELPAQ